MIKDILVDVRAWDYFLKRMVYQKDMGLSTGEILCRFDNVMFCVGQENISNGQKIYEDDIVRFDVRPHKKKGLSPADSQVGLVTCENFGTLRYGKWSAAWCCNVKVIGDKHRNPLLMKTITKLTTK